MRMAMTGHQAQQEALRLLQRVRTLTQELRSMEKRGGPDVDLKERELERLRWRLAEAVRRTASGDLGAAA
jgi:hypothetical protein